MPASPARRVPVLALALFALLATCTSLTVAQSTGGRVLGRITDPSGAVLSGVKVVLTNQATGASRDATTSSGGDYVFVEVVPGKYDVAFEHSGFKKNVSKDVLVEVNQVVTLDSVLQLGTAQEVVEVTSQAPLVETTSTQMGAVVNSRSVRSFRSMPAIPTSYCSCSQECSRKRVLICFTAATKRVWFR